MNYKTYKASVNFIVDVMESEYKMNQELQKALGSDTQVMTDMFGKELDVFIKAIETEMNDTSETDEFESWTSWLIFDVLYSEKLGRNTDLTFESKGKVYKPSIKNVWKLLKGKI